MLSIVAPHHYKVRAGPDRAIGKNKDLEADIPQRLFDIDKASYAMKRNLMNHSARRSLRGALLGVCRLPNGMRIRFPTYEGTLFCDYVPYSGLGKR